MFRVNINTNKISNEIIYINDYMQCLHNEKKQVYDDVCNDTLYSMYANINADYLNGDLLSKTTLLDGYNTLYSLVTKCVNHNTSDYLTNVYINTFRDNSDLNTLRLYVLLEFMGNARSNYVAIDKGVKDLDTIINHANKAEEWVNHSMIDEVSRMHITPKSNDIMHLRGIQRIKDKYHVSVFNGDTFLKNKVYFIIPRIYLEVLEDVLQFRKNDTFNSGYSDYIPGVSGIYDNLFEGILNRIKDVTEQYNSILAFTGLRIEHLDNDNLIVSPFGSINVLLGLFLSELKIGLKHTLAFADYLIQLNQIYVPNVFIKRLNRYIQEMGCKEMDSNITSHNTDYYNGVKFKVAPKILQLVKQSVSWENTTFPLVVCNRYNKVVDNIYSVDSMLYTANMIGTKPIDTLASIYDREPDDIKSNQGDKAIKACIKYTNLFNNIPQIMNLLGNNKHNKEIYSKILSTYHARAIQHDRNIYTYSVMRVLQFMYNQLYGNKEHARYSTGSINIQNAGEMIEIMHMCRIFQYDRTLKRILTSTFKKGEKLLSMYT